MSSEGKKKKEKVEYVDDGRSLADMSEVGGGFGDLFPKSDAEIRQEVMV